MSAHAHAHASVCVDIAHMQEMLLSNNPYERSIASSWLFLVGLVYCALRATHARPSPTHITHAKAE